MARAGAAFSGAVVVAITRAPIILHSLIAIDETPLPAACARAQLLHDAGDVAAEAVRVLELEGRAAAADPQIHVVHRDRVDAHARLARAGGRELDRAPLEHLGAAVAVQHHRFGLHANE